MLRRPAVLFGFLLLALSACEVWQPEAEAPSLAPARSMATPAVAPRMAPLRIEKPRVAEAAKTDDSEIRRAEDRVVTAPLGQKVTWSNGATGHSGSFTPVRDFYLPSGAFCREIARSVVAEAAKQDKVNLCQQTGGSWVYKP